MAYPAGVQLATLTFQNPGTFLGGEAVTTTMEVVATESVVWKATGESLDNFTETIELGAEETGSLTAPFTDQPGFADQGGNDFTGWALKVTRRSRHGKEARVVSKFWQPLIGQGTVKFENLPSTAVGEPVAVAPVPVTSVAGIVGAVAAEPLAGVLAPFLPVATVTPETVAANLPARLEEAALTATIGQLPVPRIGDGRYDKLTSVYLPDGITTPLPKWRAAVAGARAGVRSARLAIPGDSVVFGEASVSLDQPTGWVRHLRKIANDRMGAVASTGIRWQWGTIGGQTWRNFDKRFTYVDPVENTTGPFGVSALRLYNVKPNGKITFAPDMPVTAFRVYFLSNGSGSGDWLFGASIDGGAIVNKDIPATGTTNAPTALDIPAGALGVHTLTLSPAAGNLYVAGIEAIADPLHGINITEIGAPGRELYHYNLTVNGAPGWEYVTDVFDPDLTVIQFGHNEYISSQSLTVQLAQLKLAIDRAQAAGSEVLLMTSVPNQDTDNVPTIPEIMQLRYDVADQYGLPLIDIDARWGSYAESSSMNADGIHPNQTGYWEIADTVARVLLP